MGIEIDYFVQTEEENIFDYIICNHVMEHIANEEQAVSEIKRVLKTNGKWIFSSRYVLI